MPDRIDARPIIGVVGAGLLLVGLFTDWYQVPAAQPELPAVGTGNAWNHFEALDLLLGGLAIAAIYGAWEQLAGRQRFGEGWLLAVGVVALVVVASQIVNPPPAAGAEASAAKGAWLSLAGAGALFVAGVLSMARISLSLELDPRAGAPTRRRTAQDRPAA